MKQTGINSLSRKEVELIEQIREGYSCTDIIVRLHLSMQEIEMRKQKITKKLCLKDTEALENYLVYWQLELEERCAV